VTHSIIAAWPDRDQVFLTSCLLLQEAMLPESQIGLTAAGWMVHQTH
jgi:hypothetical protein